MADFAGLAFAAGVLAFFSPCSVALVPAYIGLYLPARGEGGPAAGLPPRFAAWLMALVLSSGALLSALSLQAGPPSGGVDEGPWTAPRVAAAVAAVATLVTGALAWRASAAVPKEAREGLAREGLRGALLGLAVSAGFVTVFGAVGLALAAFGGAVSDALPYVALAAAILLVALGAAMLAGRPVALTLRVFAPQKAGWVSSYLFGVGYALVSTGCLLPVFLLVVSAALAAGTGGGVGGGLASTAVMIAYAAGYSVLMVALSTYVALTRNATLGSLKRLLPHIERVAGALVLGAALYIIWFDLTTVLPST
jgi:cytochrome c biogenesis protein CcdA